MRRLIGRWCTALGLITAACLVTGGPVQARAADPHPANGHPPAATPSAVSQQTTWDHMAIGGGGYVTGMVAHPAQKDLVYIRTDVGGAYRWNPAGQSWTSITDWIKADDRDLYHIESLAVAPTDPGTVYMASGSNWAGNSSIMKSTDQGKTWTVTRVGIAINGNAGGDDDPSRSSGERLAVDPGTANIVYFGSRDNGLWHSTDAGATWSQDTRFPVTGTADRGVVFTLFARTTEPVGAPTRTIYAAVYDSGIYRSTDAGATWTLLPGSPTQPNRAALTSDGTLYVTHKSGIAKFSGGTWTNATPPTAAQYNAISVDPANPAHVIAIAANGNGTPSPFNNPIYQSTNAAGSWTQVQYIRNNTVPWWPSIYWSASTASVTFDPFNPGRVWYTDWYGTWRTDNIAASPSTWTNYEKGHEESVVVSNIESPPSGNVLLHSGVADNGGFDHTSLTAFPTSSQRDHGLPGTTTGLDFSEADPNFLVRVGRDGNSTDPANPNNSRSGYSTDGGQHYTQFPSQPEAAGRVAVSATSASIVWAAQGTGNGQVRYSTDRGTTWTVSAGAPSGMITTNGNWDGCQPLASDRVDGNKFYIYHAGKFYRSTNGGATFADTHAAGLPDNSANNGGCEWFESVKVAAAPGINGEVWISLGWNGLYRSTDSGNTFTKVAAVSDARVFGFGKGPGTASPNPAQPPSLYLHGIVNGVDGIFRSDDLSTNWTKINTTESIGCKLKDMTGDRQVFGRVYIATDGCGLYYGTLATPSLNGTHTLTTSGQALDDPALSTTAGQWMITFAPDGGVNQNWTFTQQPDGSYQLVNGTSQMCLDDGNDSMAAGNPIIQWPCNGQANQHWTATPLAGGGYTLTNKASGLLLTAAAITTTTNWAPVTQQADTNSALQHWAIN